MKDRILRRVKEYNVVALFGSERQNITKVKEYNVVALFGSERQNITKGQRVQCSGSIWQ